MWLALVIRIRGTKPVAGMMTGRRLQYGKLHTNRNKKNVDVQDRERELLVHKLHSIETHEIIGCVVMFQSLSGASMISRGLVYSIAFRRCGS